MRIHKCQVLLESRDPKSQNASSSEDHVYLQNVMAIYLSNSFRDISDRTKLVKEVIAVISTASGTKNFIFYISDNIKNEFSMCFMCFHFSVI